MPPKDKAVDTCLDTADIHELTLYKVTTNSDTTEGRGATILIGWFIHEDVARKAARGQGVMGTDANVGPLRVKVAKTPGKKGKMYLLGDEVSTRYEDPAEVRARALAKLTDEEKAALGLEGRK